MKNNEFIIGGAVMLALVVGGIVLLGNNDFNSGMNPQTLTTQQAGEQESQDQVQDPVLQSIETVNVSQFATAIEQFPEAVILDIRTPAEYADGMIGNAQNIDFYASDFASNLAKLDKEQTYLVYCNSGNRSKSALGIMKAQGFTNVIELDGGIQSWISAGNQIN